jgi:hypothetical protein
MEVLLRQVSDTQRALIGMTVACNLRECLRAIENGPQSPTNGALASGFVALGEQKRVWSTWCAISQPPIRDRLSAAAAAVWGHHGRSSED